MFISSPLFVPTIKTYYHEFKVTGGDDTSPWDIASYLTVYLYNLRSAGIVTRITINGITVSSNGYSNESSKRTAIGEITDAELTITFSGNRCYNYYNGSTCEPFLGIFHGTKLVSIDTPLPKMVTVNSSGEEVDSNGFYVISFGGQIYGEGCFTETTAFLNESGEYSLDTFMPLGLEDTLCTYNPDLTNVSYLFNNCNFVDSVTSDYFISSATNYSRYFQNSSVTDLSAPLNTLIDFGNSSKSYDLSYMFAYCDIESVNSEGLFYYDSESTNYIVGSIDMSYMFSGASVAVFDYVYYFDTGSSLTVEGSITASYMFYKCDILPKFIYALADSSLSIDGDLAADHLYYTSGVSSTTNSCIIQILSDGSLSIGGDLDLSYALAKTSITSLDYLLYASGGITVSGNIDMSYIYYASTLNMSATLIYIASYTNPVVVYGNIFLDYAYAECTASFEYVYPSYATGIYVKSSAIFLVMGNISATYIYASSDITQWRYPIFNLSSTATVYGTISLAYAHYDCTSLNTTPDSDLAAGEIFYSTSAIAVSLDLTYLFDGCTSLTKIRETLITASYISNLTMDYMLAGTSITTLGATLMNITNLSGSISATHMFELTSLSGLKYSIVTIGTLSSNTMTFDHMFDSCTSLTSVCDNFLIDTDTELTSSCEFSTSYMFNGCSYLQEVGLPFTLGSSAIGTLDYTFYNTGIYTTGICGPDDGPFEWLASVDNFNISSMNYFLYDTSPIVTYSRSVSETSDYFYLNTTDFADAYDSCETLFLLDGSSNAYYMLTESAATTLTTYFMIRTDLYMEATTDGNYTALSEKITFPSYFSYYYPASDTTDTFTTSSTNVSTSTLAGTETTYSELYYNSYIQVTIVASN